jgi:hypothetical protein
MLPEQTIAADNGITHRAIIITAATILTESFIPFS